MHLFNAVIVEALVGLSRLDAEAAEQLDRSLTGYDYLGLKAVLLAAAAPGSVTELAGEESVVGHFLAMHAAVGSGIQPGRRCGHERSSARPPYASRRDG